MTNPYQGPEADPGGPAAPPPEAVSAPRRRPPGHGWLWWRRAWRLTAANRVLWSLAMLVFMAVLMGISLVGLFVPILGNFAPTLLGPVLVAGLMRIAWRRWHDGEFDFGDLFAGFSNRTGPLFLTGLCQVVLQILFTLVMVLVALVLFGSEIAALFSTGFQGEPLDPQAIAGMGQLGLIKVLLLALIMLAVSIPYMALIWFQVPLVYFGGRGPLAALKESLVAVWRNWLSMLWYGVVAMLFMVLLAAVFGVLLVLAGMLFGPDSLAMVLLSLIVGLAALVMGLFFLALATVSMYASFRDIFGVGDDEPDATPDL